MGADYIFVDLNSNQYEHLKMTLDHQIDELPIHTECTKFESRNSV